MSSGALIYGILMLAGLIVSAIFWSRAAQRDERLLLVYIAALLGAFAGAKLLYVVAEGWRYLEESTFYTEGWLHLATGKSVVGALLGGFIAVEVGKRLIGYDKPTGDRFALMVPLALIAGRIGCLAHGCCVGVECSHGAWYAWPDAQGMARWPAVPVEILFNAACFAVLLLLRSFHILQTQHFHLYLIAYGLFRFGHEYLRATPKDFLLGHSGYQVAALILALAGLLGFILRARSRPVELSKAAIA